MPPSWTRQVIDTLPTQGGQQALTTVTPGTVTCDPLCSGVTWTPAVSGTAITWTASGTVAANTAVTFLYTAVVADIGGTAAGDVLVNSARVNNGDPAEAALTVVEPDLSILKSVDPADPVPGEAFTYTITVSNAANAPGEEGPVSTAYNATITDEVAPGIIVDVASVTASGGACTGCNQTDGGGTITWSSIAPVAPGGSATKTYLARLKSSITEGEYENLAKVPSYTSCDPDNDAPPNLVCVTDGRTYGPLEDITVVTPGEPRADLAIVKTPSGSTTPGSEWTFSLQVSNLGPSDAEGAIVVTDTLPTGLTFVSSGTGWECDQNGQDVTCTLEPLDPDPAGLAAGEDATPLTITVRTASTPPNASYTNVATVESTTTVDPNLDNNTSSATVTVAPTPVVVPPDPEKPTDPPVVVPPDPDKPVVVPPDPDRPALKPPQPAKLPALPSQIKPGRPTTILPARATTNSGQRIRVIVQCRPLYRYQDKVALGLDGSWVPLGSVRYCDVTRKKNGRVIVTVNFPGPVLVKATYSAAKAPGYAALTVVKRWVVVPR